MLRRDGVAEGWITSERATMVWSLPVTIIATFFVDTTTNNTNKYKHRWDSTSEDSLLWILDTPFHFFILCLWTASNLSTTMRPPLPCPLPLPVERSSLSPYARFTFVNWLKPTPVSSLKNFGVPRYWKEVEISKSLRSPSSSSAKLWFTENQTIARIKRMMNPRMARSIIVWCAANELLSQLPFQRYSVARRDPVHTTPPPTMDWYAV